MGRAFNYQGPSVDAGELPDPDPNITPPDADRIFDSPPKTERNGDATTVQWALDMDVAGSADVTVWLRDRVTGTWFRTATQSGATDKEMFEVTGVAGAELFFQLTNPATFATVIVVAESAP